MNRMYPLRGLRDALTPSVQTFGTPQSPSVPVQQIGPGAVPGGITCPPGSSCGPDGKGGTLACPPGLVYYPSYVDSAGITQYPGCMFPTNKTLGPGGTTAQGGTSTLNPTSGGPGSPQGTAGGQPPPGTPPTSVVAQAPNNGTLPLGQGNVSNINLGATYRFILAMGGGYATGASLPGCTQTNSGACDPQFFGTLKEAIQYALQRGEIPYQVFQASDPWAIMLGTQPINPAQIYNADGSLGGSFSMGTIVLLGVAAYFLLRRAS